MKKLIVLIIGTLTLCGCSELQVIGMASVRELSADAISVEKERYQPRQAPEIKRVDSPILVAKVARLEGRQAKAGARELWRNN